MLVVEEQSSASRYYTETHEAAIDLKMIYNNLKYHYIYMYKMETISQQNETFSSRHIY